MSPQKFLHLIDVIPQTCEHVSLHGTREFTDMKKLKGHEIGDYPGLMTLWAQDDHKGPYKREAGVSESQKEMQ